MRLAATVCQLLALSAVASAYAHGPEDNLPPVPYIGLTDASTAPESVQQVPGQTLPLKPTRKIEFDTDEGTWMSLDVSPDGKTLVFELMGDLYALDVAGGQAAAMTHGLPFDSQPTYAPDGKHIAYLSDRSGAENVWIANADGSDAEQLSFRDDYDTFVSPAWAADGKSIYVSRHRSDLNGFELWQYEIGGDRAGKLLLPIKTAGDEDDANKRSTLGVAPSADGKYLYYAAFIGKQDYDIVPEWSIRRRDLKTNVEEVIVSAPRSPRPDLSLGSAFRPVLSPDGRQLVYATRYDGRTGLRLLDLQTRADRWLIFPLQQDQLQAFASRDLFPRYTFAPDGKSLLLNALGKLSRLDIATGKLTDIPFNAHVALDIGPFLRHAIKQETGPVRARLIQAPEQSPDGKQLAFSALAQIYLMDLSASGTAKPHRLTHSDATEFQPTWSPDGKSIVYVTWTAREGGHLWSAPANGKGEPRRLTDVSAFYTNPVFTPDGRTIVAVRSSNSVRMHGFMEYGSLRQAEVIKLPAAGGAAVLVTQGFLGGKPQITADSSHVYVNSADGVYSVALDGSTRTKTLLAIGPGWYFSEGPAPVDDLKVSPDGKWALAQIAQQLHVLEVPNDPQVPVDLSHPTVRHRKLTSVGADFFAWADGGRTITWAVGSTFYRRALADVTLDAPGTPSATVDAPPPGKGGVSAFNADVEVPRDVPHGAVVLRGATAITIHGDEIIRDADVVVVDDHIVAVGRRGEVTLPEDAAIRDLSGKFIVPGFIDTHDHYADIRRNVLDLETWGPIANLAYGVTTGFDPSTLSIDTLAYQDLMDAGRMVGSRMPSTGPALFSFNEFKSKQEVLDVLSRNRDHYRTLNLKEYRTGNRRVRQWVAEASRELGLVPTTEGALSPKLDFTQIMDGFAGNEHSLTVVPFYKDVVQLVSQSRVSYTLTLLITNGGPEGQDFYIAKNAPHDDPRLNHFWPHYAIDIKTLQRPWRDPRGYLFPRLAEGAAQVQRAGGLIGIGSHGELPGIGFHWEMQAHAAGGMTPMEVLRAATLGSAETIGRDSEFGSLEPGKYADLVVLERNPLDDISNTLSVVQVMKNGRLYDAATLNELWPRQRPLPPLWFWADNAP